MDQQKGICNLSIIPVRKTPNDTSEMVTQLLLGDTFSIIEKRENWHAIKIDADGYEGWIDSKQYELENEIASNKIILNSQKLYITENYGVLSMGSILNLKDKNFFFNGKNITVEEKLNKQLNIKDVAMQYLNVPYLWGGKSIFGIDCSGFTQMVFKIMGIALQRDANQQVEEGLLINFNQQQQGDLAFFNNKEGKIIHVGIVLNENQIIHASGKVRIDKLDTKGIFNNNTQKYSHILFCIKRKNIS